MTRSTRKLHPRVEYRMMQNQRVSESPSLAEKFKKLKSLTVTLEHFDSTGTTRSGGMKYKVNLDHAKSMFLFNCPSGECVGGDFDLSKELADAIAQKRKAVEGEARCHGTRHYREKKQQTNCENLLRYKLILSY